MHVVALVYRSRVPLRVRVECHLVLTSAARWWTQGIGGGVFLERNSRRIRRVALLTIGDCGRLHDRVFTACSGRFALILNTDSLRLAVPRSRLSAASLHAVMGVSA
jgi:hypothetical protein